MEKYSLGDELSQAEKDYSIGGNDKFKFEEGDNSSAPLSGKAGVMHRIFAEGIPRLLRRRVSVRGSYTEKRVRGQGVRR
jgi:hypothetical protein